MSNNKDIELDKRMIKYWWNKHKNIEYIKSPQWPNWLKDEHKDIIEDWLKFKYLEKRLNDKINKL